MSSTLTRATFWSYNLAASLRPGKVWVIFLFTFFSSFFVMGQSGVTITSTTTSPTQQNPVPVRFNFNSPINGFDVGDVMVTGGSLNDFFVQTPNFGYETNLERLGGFRMNPFGTITSQTVKDAVIAFDLSSTGRVFALTFDNGVLRYDQNGTATNPSKIISQDEFSEPRDIAIDEDGNIYVADSGNNRIVVFNNSGARVGYLSQGNLSSPSGLAIDSQNRIYVADTGNNRIVVYERSGVVLNIITGSGSRSLNTPVRLAVDKNFHIYINDLGNKRIQIFDNNQNYIGTIPAGNANLRSPGSLVVDSYGFIYIADFKDTDLQKFLNFSTVGVMDLIAVAFGDLDIKVFRADNLTAAPSIIKREINIPLDLALKPCGFLAVNNADAGLESFSEARIYFDYKTYNILPDTFTANLQINEECAAATLQVPSGIGVNKSCGAIPSQASNTYEVLWDATPPVIQGCFQEDFTVESGYVLPRFFEVDGFGAVDNCGGAVTYQQTPVAGTTITANTNVRITAEDAAGNLSLVCEFKVLIREEAAPLAIQCPQDRNASRDNNCSFTVPDYKSELTVNYAEAVLTQNPPAGSVISSSRAISFTATLGGEEVTCSFYLTLTDNSPPSFTCPGDQNENFDPAVGFTLPNYTTQINATDNCGIETILQDPAPGTVIFEDTLVIIYVWDTSAMMSNCSFNVRLVENDVLDISCPQPQTFALDVNCSYIVPDFTGEVQVNFPGASIAQFPPQGNVINESTEIVLTATLEGQTARCTFELTLEDKIKPEIECPVDQIENFDPAVGFEVPDYRPFAQAMDGCGTPDILQNPAPGAVIFNSRSITLTAVDNSGNEEVCSFMLTLTEEEVLEISCPQDKTVETDDNCAFVLPDYRDEITANFPGFQISQVPAPGEVIYTETTILLTATLNGETDQCSFTVYLEKDEIAPVAGCVSGYTLGLNSNGTATLTVEEINFNSSDNCGIVSMSLDKTNFTISDIGDNIVILTVLDAAGNVDTCQTTVTVTAYEAPNDSFECRSEVVLPLDEQGNAALSPEDLYTGDPGDRTFSLNQSIFTCSNIGENIITLTYSTGNSSESCDVRVLVIDETPPVARSRNVTVFLNEQGQVNISPALIDAGSTDNCGSVTVRLEKSNFTCSNLGENRVNLIVTDASGNEARAVAIVNVTGECEVQPPLPVDGVKYIFVYPNPTQGSFAIATPRGVSISKIEVYDYRGRFLQAKEFTEDLQRYTMDISGVEQAVYVLKLITNNGEVIRRVIKK